MTAQSRRRWLWSLVFGLPLLGLAVWGLVDNAKLEVNSGVDIVAILSGRAAAAKARREAEPGPADEA